jgi:glutamate synthase (NADPH) large chain
MTGSVLVLLGPVGRNFGAGMSGGVAYLLDPARKNVDMVNPGTVTLSELDDDDRAGVARLLTRHATSTGSAVSARLLAAGAAGLASFVRVAPLADPAVDIDVRRAALAHASAWLRRAGEPVGVTPGR